MDLLKGKKRIHFVGIGGIGMSGIAQLLVKKGFDISGSDIKDSDIIGILKSSGIKVFLNHNFLNIQDSELVVYSSAISPDNPELIAAREKGIPVVMRAKVLAELMNEKVGIAISGAHGKTTTSSMTALLLKESSLNPTVAVGGIVKNFSNNALLGEGNFFVIEADESDGSFLYYRPFYSVITNIDKEHLDYYRNIDEIIEAYAKFADNTKKGGKLICFGQDKNIQKMLRLINKKYLNYGLDKSLDIYADDIKLERLSSNFNCFFRNKPLGRFFLNVPGIHNVLNSLAVIGIGIELCIDLNLIKSALLKFDGIERRFQIKLELESITVIDDYAHHPSEIQATIKVFDNWPKERLITVFQPHRFTRTKYLTEEFGKSFAGSNLVIITEIYAAGEKPIPGVSADLIIQALKKNGHLNCLFVPRQELMSVLLDIVKKGDILLMLGAGDIGRFSTEFSEVLKKIKYHSDKL
jgi:UDP-N-acetylmuramate--alanine ligase